MNGSDWRRAVNGLHPQCFGVDVLHKPCSFSLTSDRWCDCCSRLVLRWCRTASPEIIMKQLTACVRTHQAHGFSQHCNDVKDVADLGSSSAVPVQMAVPPVPAPPQPTAASPARPANGHTATDKAAENDSDAQAGAPELQTPSKNGKRRRGGRVSLLCITLPSTGHLLGWESNVQCSEFPDQRLSLPCHALHLNSDKRLCSMAIRSCFNGDF